MWEPLIYIDSPLVRSPVTTWACDWHLTWGSGRQSHGTAPDLWDLTLSRCRQHYNEVEFWDIQLLSQELLGACCMENLPTNIGNLGTRTHTFSKSMTGSDPPPAFQHLPPHPLHARAPLHNCTPALEVCHLASPPATPIPPPRPCVTQLMTSFTRKTLQLPRCAPSHTVRPQCWAFPLLLLLVALLQTLFPTSPEKDMLWGQPHSTVSSPPRK